MARQLLSSLKDLDMDPSDTVARSFSSSSSSSTPTPTPTALSSSVTGVHPLPSSSPSTGMAGTEALQIAHLSKMVEQLLAANNALSSQVEQLQLQAQHNPSPFSPPLPAPVVPPSPQVIHSSSHFQMKVAPPSLFDGNLAKSEDFLTSLTLYFQGKGGNFTDGQKIIFTLSYMKDGTAGQWAKRKVKLLHQEGQTWEQFLADFKASFSDPDPAETARMKIAVLKQGSHSAEEYVASFKELMDDTGYNDAALVHMFQRGLSRTLVDKIYSLPELPKTLEDWVSFALRFDRLWRRREHMSKVAATNHQVPPVRHSSNTSNSNSQPSMASTQVTSPPPRQTSIPPKSSSNVVPMEVDSGRKRLGPSVCFKCRKPGHFARDCKSTFDINSLDYAGLQAYFLKEQQEAQAKERSSDTPTTTPTSSQHFQ